MAEFEEVADRVWVARYPWFDVNVTAVGSERGLVVVDTHSSTAAAREVIDDLRRLGAGDVVAVVNTHAHMDHVLGSAAFRAAFGAIPVHAHETAAADTVRVVEDFQRAIAETDDPHREEVLATEPFAADHTFSSIAVVDLGDRVLELVHPGKGHTAGDLVVRVPDADALLAGDLIEQSGPPAYGPDCHPMDWPLSMDLVLQLVTPTTIVVPGHGTPVDRDFVMDQRGDLGIVAETIRDLAGRGVPQSEALTAADWPFEPDRLEHALARGYEQLPRAQRRLPLV